MLNLLPRSPRQHVGRVAHAGTVLTGVVAATLLAGTLTPAQAVPASCAPTWSAPEARTVPVATKARAKRAIGTVTIGRSSFPLAGTNMARRTKRVVIYQAPRRTTRRSKRGVDVLVVKGKVARVQVLRPGKRKVRVPANGYVVSGKGSAARWLRSAARVGTPVATRVTWRRPSRLLGLPRRVTSVYWTNWNEHLKITQVPRSYNTLLLFAASRGRVEGSVVWKPASPTTSQINKVRGRGQRVVLSTGGAGNGINFHSRYVSRNFVRSILAINQKFGGTLRNPKIDGVDFNTFEAGAVPKTSEYLWMFRELKRQFGRKFIISAPPAPWKPQDKSMIRQALSQGLMDYAAPQYYDGPGMSDPSYIISSVRDWVTNVAGGDARKIAVGFGMESLPHFSTAAQIRTAWDALERLYPAMRGAFVWQHRTDAARGWVFAKQINPRIAD